MSVRYYRRYKMEISLRKRSLPEPTLPADCVWIPWREPLIDRHAEVKYLSFSDEVDAEIFSTFRELRTCRHLMQEIGRHPLFIPEATWLVARRTSTTDREPLASNWSDVATIQGLGRTQRLGAIQNVGVIPTARGLGLGRALVLQALAGFRAAGKQRVSLEVTAGNHAAIHLYQSIGFRVTRTVYKAVEVEDEKQLAVS